VILGTLRIAAVQFLKMSTSTQSTVPGVAAVAMIHAFRRARGPRNNSPPSTPIPDRQSDSGVRFIVPRARSFVKSRRSPEPRSRHFFEFFLKRLGCPDRAIWPWRDGEGRLDQAGHQLACIDSPVKHAFTFTPSVSLFVECRDEADLDAAFGVLAVRFVNPREKRWPLGNLSVAG
jgi:hypothetical protein